MSLALAILKALAAFPSIKQAIEQAFSAYLAWLDIKEANRITSTAIGLRNAKTQEEKRKALEDWFNATK